jgi:hypothetical protein
MTEQSLSEERSGWRLLGTIVRLQVQTASLKAWRGAEKVYDPAPLQTVEQLWLSARGVSARYLDGSRLLDVHHMDHPLSRNRQGKNGISLGFTSHYRAMRARFGERVVNGIAGENVLIEREQLVKPEELAGELLIVSPASGRQVRLTHLQVATPCLEFTRFASGADAEEVLEPAELKAALQFLDRGMRGFYATCLEVDEVAIACGDEVYLQEQPAAGAMAVRRRIEVG